VGALPLGTGSEGSGGGEGVRGGFGVARCTAEELSFYGISISVSGGSGDSGGGVGMSGAESGGSDGAGGIDTLVDVPKCRRCPALRPDTAYVAYIAVVGGRAGRTHIASNHPPTPGVKSQSNLGLQAGWRTLDRPTGRRRARRPLPLRRFTHVVNIYHPGQSPVDYVSLFFLENALELYSQSYLLRIKHSYGNLIDHLQYKESG